MRWRRQGGGYRLSNAADAEELNADELNAEGQPSRRVPVPLG